MLKIHWEFDGNTFKRNESNTSTLPPKEEKTNPLGACYLTSLATKKILLA
jgi:hypothetical protein